MTPGQVAYEAARSERLSRRPSDDVVEWAELNDWTRIMWEAAARAVMPRAFVQGRKAGLAEANAAAVEHQCPDETARNRDYRQTFDALLTSLRSLRDSGDVGGAVNQDVEMLEALANRHPEPVEATLSVASVQPSHAVVALTAASRRPTANQYEVCRAADAFLAWLKKNDAEEQDR
jgi:hypothetical protein